MVNQTQTIETPIGAVDYQEGQAIFERGNDFDGSNALREMKQELEANTAHMGRIESFAQKAVGQDFEIKLVSMPTIDTMGRYDEQNKDIFFKDQLDGKEISLKSFNPEATAKHDALLSQLSEKEITAEYNHEMGSLAVWTLDKSTSQARTYIFEVKVRNSEDLLDDIDDLENPMLAIKQNEDEKNAGEESLAIVATEDENQQKSVFVNMLTGFKFFRREFSESEEESKKPFTFFVSKEKAEAVEEDTEISNTRYIDLDNFFPETNFVTEQEIESQEDTVDEFETPNEQSSEISAEQPLGPESMYIVEEPLPLAMSFAGDKEVDKPTGDAQSIETEDQVVIGKENKDNDDSEDIDITFDEQNITHAQEYHDQASEVVALDTEDDFEDNIEFVVDKKQEIQPVAEQITDVHTEEQEPTHIQEPVVTDEIKVQAESKVVLKAEKTKSIEPEQPVDVIEEDLETASTQDKTEPVKNIIVPLLAQEGSGELSKVPENIPQKEQITGLIEEDEFEKTKAASAKTLEKSLKKPAAKNETSAQSVKKVEQVLDTTEKTTEQKIESVKPQEQLPLVPILEQEGLGELAVKEIESKREEVLPRLAEAAQSIKPETNRSSQKESVAAKRDRIIDLGQAFKQNFEPVKKVIAPQVQRINALHIQKREIKQTIKITPFTVLSQNITLRFVNESGGIIREVKSEAKKLVRLPTRKITLRSEIAISQYSPIPVDDTADELVDVTSSTISLKA